MEKYHGNTVEYWKQNAEENYLTTPISVLKYITVLEEQAEQLRKHAVSSLVCPCSELPNGEIAISSKALQKPYGDLGQTDC
jgi:hypothetical protein